MKQYTKPTFAVIKVHTGNILAGSDSLGIHSITVDGGSALSKKRSNWDFEDEDDYDYDYE